MTKKDTRARRSRKSRIDRRDPQALAEAFERETAPLRKTYEVATAALDQYEAGNESIASDLLEHFETERAKHEEADAPKLAAREAYRALMRKMFEAWPPIAPAHYRTVFFDGIVPAYNAAFARWKLCVECGTRFSVSDHARPEDARFCSKKCNATAHNRGRRRAGAREKLERRLAALKEHSAGCPLLKRRQECPRCLELLAAAIGARKAVDDERPPADAFDHASGGESLEMAQEQFARLFRPDEPG